MSHIPSKHGLLNAGAWGGDTKPSWSFSMIEDLLGSLAPIEEVWASLPDPAAVTRLQQREQVLGVATLSSHSFSLLHELIGAVGMPSFIWRHAPSLRAVDKQLVLAALLDTTHRRVLVNKTVTIRLGSVQVLCTGVGDFTVNRGLLSAVAATLRLPKRVVRECHINPLDYAPEYELGLLTGMVSPFFPPWVASHRLHAVVLLTEADVGDEPLEHLVAISLSPFESLLVPLAPFQVLVRLYARRAYPQLRWIEIDRYATTSNVSFAGPRAYSDESYRELYRRGIKASIPAGTTLWRQGDPGDYLLVVLEGTLDIVVESGDDRGMVVDTAEPGALVGELSALDGQPRSASVRSRTACEVLSISGAAFRDVLHSTHDLLEELYRLQVDRVRRLMRRGIERDGQGELPKGSGG